MFKSLFGSKKAQLPTSSSALPGREEAMVGLPDSHYVLDAPLTGPWPEQMEVASFGLGCFWGAERRFWQLPGVYSTAVGYQAGLTPNPTYAEVCSGLTGHNEVVQVVFDPAVIRYEQLVAVFFESHDPTQGMRQGNDVGTQYRSGIYPTSPEQLQIGKAALAAYGQRLAEAGFGAPTTEVVDGGRFYYAEAYHQQYLAKNPGGYCGLGGTGVSCPVGVLSDG